MKNISRTTLRELKKRYLNVLKKCFLANLMAFGMVTLATPATAGEDKLLNYHDKTYTSDVTFEDLKYSGDAGAILNRGTITFGGDATFTNNAASSSSISSSGGAIYNDGGTITFGESSTATFTDNLASNFGGAIDNNGGTIAFGGDASFTGNSASASGGAINNWSDTITFGGDATFTGNSTSTFGGAIENYGSSSKITFNGDATFTDNSASSYGGAINNSGTIAFGGDASFTGNSASGSGGAINNGSTITFNGDATFTGNSASDNGGAIDNNGGTIAFGGDASFTGNSASRGGGAIYNDDGTITFGGATTFTENIGRAIYNDGGTITFGGVATFTDNPTSSYGGAIYNSKNGDITFGGAATFTDNSTSSDGGAIGNIGTITFGGDTTFTNNSASSSGGAIYNDGGTITFNDNFLFSGNTVTGTNANGADIYNEYGTINFAQGEGKVGTLDGGIYQSGNSAKINKTGTGTLILGDGMVNGYYTYYASQFNQSAGLTIAHTDKLTFAKTNTITGGELRVHGDRLPNLKGSVSSGAMLTYLTTNTGVQTVALPSVLTVKSAILTFGAYTDEAKNAELALVADKKVPKLDSNGEVEYDTNGNIVYEAYDAESKLLTTGTIDRAKYNLISDISGAQKVIFKDSDVTIASGTYNASYDFENARIGNYNGTITFGEGSSVYFNNNTANGVANDITNNSGTINILGEVKSDIHLVSDSGTIGLKAKDTDGDGKVTYGGSYKLTNTTLDLSGDGVKEVTIENLTVSGSSALKWDAEITDTGDSYSVASDIKNLTATGQFTAGTINVMGGNKGEWYDVTLTDLYNQPLIKNGAQINYVADGLYKTKDITNGISINFVDVTLPQTLGEVLRSTTASTFDFGDYVTVNEGETLNYVISEKDLQNGSMGEVGSGEKIIRGATKEASDTVINANGVGRIFYLGTGDKLTLENLTIAGAKSSSSGGAIYNYRNYAGLVNLNNVAFTGNSASSGGVIDHYQGGIIFSGEATFTGNSASESGGVINNYNGTIIFGGDATFTGNSASSSGGAIYNAYATITFGEGSSVYFKNNTANGVANDITNNSGAINILGEVKSDIHLVSDSGTIGLKAKDTDGDGKVNYGGSYKLSNTRLDLSGDGIKEVSIENLTGSGASLMIDALFTKETDGSITMTADKLNSANAYQFNGVMVNMGGQEVLNALINELKVDQSGNINPAISYTQAILGGNATLKDTKTSQLSTTSPYIYQMVTSGQDLTVSADVLKGSALEYLNDTDTDVTLQIAEKGDIDYTVTEDLGEMGYGTKQILGSTEGEAIKSVINANGKELFTLNNKDTSLTIKDVTITGAKEFIDNKVGSVSLENVILDASTGETAIINASEMTLKDVSVDKGINNTGTITGEGTLSLAGLSGAGTLTMNGATLDVADKFATSNKVISNNMKIGDAVKEISFAELEVKEGTTLDIDNKHVTAGKVTFGNESTLSVTLNELADYGTLSHDEVVGDENAKLNLKLTNGIDTELGIYQVFNKDNDLSLIENKLFLITDNQDGSYQVEKRSTSELQESLSASETEASITNALMSANSKNPMFTRMQSEVLDALQSQDAGTVAKAKKALNALGARSTSVYQSQATAQFTQMHTVITQMLMNSTAPVFGHAGGEEPARATVYVKGLYDRVNSLAGDGFRMRSKGAVLGVQSAITEDLTVGIGYAGINSVAKEPLRRTEVDTNTGFISAQYQPNNWWVNGVLTYSRSQYDEEKNILSTKGIANYDVDSLGAQITTGYNIKRGNWIVTPEVGVRYLNARQEGYVDSLGTTVEKTTSDFVTTMAGFKVGVDLGWMRPLAGVMVGYDVVTDDISAVNTLANKETYIIKGEALDRLSTTVVAGFAADISDNATLKLEYSGNYRKEYLDHSGMLRLEWKF